MDEREPLMRRGAIDQRLRSLMQNLILHPQPIKLSAKLPQLGSRFSIHGYELTVINSTGHEQEPCRTSVGRKRAAAES